ncbi:hypothetical protein HY045_00210 [Candidatus Woesebacteria bacterium]|nr:hypothetical protein [Candidatus Woesebacteria bacterium]
MVEIIPAILTNDLTEIEEKLRRIEDLEIGGVNIHRAQIDVIDGVFADNKTVDPALLSNVDTNLLLDFHLMCDEPVKWIEKSVNAGADRIIGQIEKMTNQIEFVEKVTETGLGVGLAVDIDTPISRINPVVLTNIDVVLLMAVKAGFGGQKFNPKVLDKIRELDEIRSNDQTPFKICVDGGETEEVIDKTHFEGADEVVIGKRLFIGDMAVNLNRLQEAAHGISKT